MRKTIIALAACAPLLVALPAHATAPKAKDPVRALKSEFVAGHGVRFTETTTLSGEKTKVQSRKGTFQFNAKGIVAHDIVTTFAPDRLERVISVGKFSYLKSPSLLLLEGKTWARRSRGVAGGGSFNGQVINPAESKTLAALIKKGKLTKRAITGKITFKELDKISPWFAMSVPLRMQDDATVTYALTLTSAGLVSRVKSSYAATAVFDVGNHEGKTMTIDSRFTGWGAKTSIKAPDPKTVDVRPIQ
ncbi:hypothetical protein ACIBQX_41865 [Nonomuraea sp. NPDC049714]|uniref:hypothetical protein n=1 Tax=Nonomuraea sp. NPDC049714 TaxID=3364357 RepID=UPI00378F7D42